MFNNMKNNKKKELISEINVTPFVDVLLILLVIFIVISPMINNGFDVSLPQSNKTNINNNKPVKVMLSVDREGSIYVDDSKISSSNLIKSLSKHNKKDTQIFIKGDKNVSYKYIIDTMSTLNSNGFYNISLLTIAN